MVGGLRATPDLIAPTSLARSVAGSQYSLNNNAINTSSLLSGGNLSSSGLNLHLLQQQLHQQLSTQTPINVTANHSVNPSQQELHSASTHGGNAGANISVTNINGSSGGGGIGATGNRLVETSLVNQLSLLPNVSATNVAGLGSHSLQVNSVDADQLKSLLPAYRQAPDYNTAVQIKYGAVVPVAESSSEALYENQRKVSVDVRTHALHLFPHSYKKLLHLNILVGNKKSQ